MTTRKYEDPYLGVTAIASLEEAPVFVATIVSKSNDAADGVQANAQGEPAGEQVMPADRQGKGKEVGFARARPAFAAEHDAPAAARRLALLVFPNGDRFGRGAFVTSALEVGRKRKSSAA